MLEHAVDNRTHDACVDTDELLTGHAGLAGNTGSDHHHVAAFGGGIVVGHAAQTGVGAQDAGGLHDVHGLAFADTLFDIQQNYFIGDLVAHQNVCTCSAYVAGAHYCYF